MTPTQPPAHDDLRARHVECLQNLLAHHVSFDENRKALKAAIAALSALPEAGEAVGEVYESARDDHGQTEMRVDWAGDPPPEGTKLYATPPAAVSQPAAMVEGFRDWIPVAEKMPKGTHPVLVYFETVYGKGRIVRARHVGKFEVEDEGGENEDFAEYSEETDTYYWPPGWYECNDAKGEDWMMSDTPTYWQSLPPPPSLLSAGAVQGGAK